MRRKKVKNKRNWACVFCNKSFPSFSTIFVHILSHIKEKPFFCKICGGSFVRKRNLTIHLLTLHSNLDSVKKKIEKIKHYKCECLPSCGKIFLSKSALNIHQWGRRRADNLKRATDTNSEDLQTPRRRHGSKTELNVTCDLCDETMIQSVLRTHQLQCHPEDFYITTRIVRRRRNRIRTSGEGQGHRDQDHFQDESVLSPARIICQICDDDEFENDSELFQHRRDHLDLHVKDDDEELDLNQIRYKCLFCPGVFKGMELLEKHFGEVHKANVDLNQHLEENGNESVKLKSIAKSIKKKKKEEKPLEMKIDPGPVVDEVMELEDACSHKPEKSHADFDRDDNDDDDKDEEKENGNGNDVQFENEDKIESSTHPTPHRKKKTKRKRRRKKLFSTLTIESNPTVKPTPTPITLPKWSYRSHLHLQDDEKKVHDEIEIAQKIERDTSSVDVKKQKRRRNRRRKNKMKNKGQRLIGELFLGMEMFEKHNDVKMEVQKNPNQRRSVNLVRHALQLDEEFTPTPGKKNKKK